MLLKRFQKLKGLLWGNNKIVFLLFLAMPILIIANSNVEFFCITQIKDRFVPLTNENVFLGSLIIFIISNSIIISLILRSEKLMKLQRIFNICVLGAQLLIILLIITLFLQMVLYSYYSVVILSGMVYLASSMSIGILIISLLKLYSWYILKKQFLILLHLAIVSLLIIVTGIGSFYISQNLAFLPATKIPNDIFHKSCSIMFSANKPTDPYNMNVSFGSRINLALPYNITLILAFVLTWFTSVLILKEYARRIGLTQYAVLVSLPLIFFAFRYVDYFVDLLIYLNAYNILPTVNVFLSLIKSTSLNILVEFSLLFGSLFFALVFLKIYTKIPKLSKLKSSVLITALGTFLLFSSRELIGLFLTSYPPLGIMTISFIGISSYLFFYGIFSTAKFISRNTELKNQIFMKLGSDSVFLDKISSAENEHVILGMVRSASRKSEKLPAEKIDIPDENELRLLVKDILTELKKNQHEDK